MAGDQDGNAEIQAVQGDVAANAQLPLTTLMEARPALAAFALSPFMKKGVHPDLVTRMILAVWHTIVIPRNTEDWQDGDWTHSINVCTEGNCPHVPDGKATTSALFCVEELGVSPPPDTGWVPKETVKESARSNGHDPEQVDWWRNTNNRDWIYHRSQDLYFHLPSNSLWEKRHVDCHDPDEKGAPISYLRVDFMHCWQALSHFALSLDVGLLPLAFKAWVRYMRKKKDRHFGLPAPPASPGKGMKGSQGGHSRSGSRAKTSQTQSGRADAAKPKTSSNVSPHNTDPTEEPSLQAKGPVTPPVEVPNPIANEANKPICICGTVFMDDSIYCRKCGLKRQDALGGHNAESKPPERDDAKRPVDQSKVGPNSPQANEKKVNSANAQEPKSSAEAQPFASKNEKGKGLSCLRCFRSSRGRQRPEEKVAAAAQLEPTVPSAPIIATSSSTKGNRSPQAASPRAKESNSNLNTARFSDTPSQEAPVKMSIDTVERHMRKLEAFMELVKRNPQRLVDHVNKRREDRTSLGFMVF